MVGTPTTRSNIRKTCVRLMVIGFLAGISGIATTAATRAITHISPPPPFSYNQSFPSHAAAGVRAQEEALDRIQQAKHELAQMEAWNRAKPAFNIGHWLKVGGMALLMIGAVIYVPARWW